MKINIELESVSNDNGDLIVTARAQVAGSSGRGAVRHTISAYELSRSYNRQKLIDDTESRATAAAMAAAKAKA